MQFIRDIALLLIALLFLPVIIAIIPLVVLFGHKPKVIALGIDQLGGAVLYGQENYTVSSYTHLLCTRGKKSACLFEKLINFFFGKEHCKRSYEWERIYDAETLNEFGKG